FGNARTVVRGGYGIFYSEPMTYMGWSAGSTLRQGVTVTSNPTFPNITLANAFPEELRVESRNVTVISRDLRTPMNQQWTLGVQRELVQGLALDVAYLGNVGRMLISGSQKNINQPRPGPGAVAARRPYPSYNSISLFESDGESDYHALRSGLQRRLLAERVARLVAHDRHHRHVVSRRRHEQREARRPQSQGGAWQQHL